MGVSDTERIKYKPIIHLSVSPSILKKGDQGGGSKTMTVKRLAVLTARNLRKKQTVAEEILWARIRNKQINGIKFLRQHPVFYEYDRRERYFIADFYCKDLHLVIEIDGGIHEQQKDLKD